MSLGGCAAFWCGMFAGCCGKDSRGAEGVLERNIVERKNEARAEPRIACFLVGERSRTKQKAALMCMKKIFGFIFALSFVTVYFMINVCRGLH